MPVQEHAIFHAAKFLVQVMFGELPLLKYRSRLARLTVTFRH